MQRTVFATPRAAEFLELRALQAQTGQPAEAFGHVVVKELIDNALDAAESAGRPPVIDITTRTDGDITYVTVADNGDGITAGTVADICNFDLLVSDKARYRGPARGAQGNALKTLLGIPYALGVSAPVIVDTISRHELRVMTDPAGHVVVERTKARRQTSAGTSVTVPLPADLDIDIHRWAYGAALVNPHATITTIDQAYGTDSDGPVLYKPSNPAWSKWTPACPSSPHWYDPASFTALVYAHIHQIRRTGVDVALGKFITEFDGLTGSAKQQQIRRVAPGITHLSQLHGRDNIITALHAAMCREAKPTPASRLGPVKAEHYRAMFDAEYSVRRFWFSSKTVSVGGVPWIIEVAVADTGEFGGVHYAVNHAPGFDDPLGRTRFSGEVFGTGTWAFLRDIGGHWAVVVHVICAAPQFTDKGKVALAMPTGAALAASAALGAATKTLRREAEQRRRDAARADRAAQRARDDANRADRQLSIKDAVFQVLPEAKQAAGDIVAARTLFYKVRPLIQAITDAELGYSYFSQTLLPEYERTVAPLPGLYYEARGELHHPHDGNVIPLGTREVESYIPPSWQFDKILYVEKTGLAAQLAPYRLGQRYDMAVIYGKGYAATACRDLLARSDIRDMKIFVLHDADLDGYNIARTLGEATARMPDHSVDVIDLGLKAWQADENGLETETFTRRKELPSDLVLDELAEQWFTGEAFDAGNGKVHYLCERCELNAFSADGLAQFIEAGLESAGGSAKLIPPEEVLTRHVESSRQAALTELVTGELAQLVDIDAVVNQLLTENPDLASVGEDDVSDRLTDHDIESWRGAARALVADDIDDADLGERARELLTEQINEIDG